MPKAKVTELNKTATEASAETLIDNETIKIDTQTESAATAAPMSESVATKAQSRLEEFAKTSKAAKLSGVFHKTTGTIKRKIGELRDDKDLQDAGRNQELLGKVHRLVGSLRAIREGTVATVNSKRKETQAICIKHGGRLLDVAGDFMEDLKKTLLK